MTLKWKKGSFPNREALGQDITELAPDAHGTAYADWGIFCLDIEARMTYKDGTQQYRVFLYTKEAVSCVQIPLLSIRGYLAEAIKATEDLLFSKEYDFPANTFQSDHPCNNAKANAESNQKLPVCQMVQSERIYSPQEYVEAVTGHCFCFPKEDTVQEIQDKLDRYCVDSLWNYPMTEIDHIVESNLRVVLVDVSGFYGGNEIVPQYRWFEVPEDFREEVA